MPPGQSPRGFELGFKAPLFGSDLSTGPSNVTIGDHFASFYLLGVLTLGGITFGYRF